MSLLATCCTLAALASPAAAPFPRWEPLADDLRRPVEIDRSRIVRDRGLVEVWIRMRGDADAVAREFEAAGVDEDGVERVRSTLNHSLHLWAFHCDDGSHALAVSAYYSDDGSLIREFRPARRAYWPVQPDTVGHRLLDVACGRAHGGPLAADRDDGPEAAADDGTNADEVPARAGDPPSPRAR